MNCQRKIRYFRCLQDSLETLQILVALNHLMESNLYTDHGRLVVFCRLRAQFRIYLVQVPHSVLYARYNSQSADAHQRDDLSNRGFGDMLYEPTDQRSTEAYGPPNVREQGCGSPWPKFFKC
jgi:hypothetical protein